MRSLIFLCVLVFGAASAATADPVVVELFASQNCKSCPKAHVTLQQAAEERGDLLILTWAVDYWDYLGESDPMAMPESKTRQAAYAERFNLRGPYTPQSVFNGERQCSGSKPDYVRNHLDALQSMDGLQMTYAAGHLMISGKTPAPADIWLIHFIPYLETRTATITNAITSVTRLGQWTDASSQGFDISCADGCAVLVQEEGYGPIRGALQLN